MDILSKLEILADAAKYDASCASSGTDKRNSLASAGIGSTSSMGICHSYAPDGRCISLLKILLTNFCTYECDYCVNRASSDVPRARFSVDEVVNLTLDFYKRNYIEGLFLSSGIIQNADYTMEQVVAVARTLRVQHRFNGYIHLKTIPEATPELLAEAGLYADRLSINIELPTAQSLQQLAPEKSSQSIEYSMLRMHGHITEYKDEKKRAAKTGNRKITVKRFAPAGQSTQMIVGADDSNDATVLHKADALYHHFKMRRVYYSAFSPIPSASKKLPLQAPPLVREHRLYQADWLLRFYGFKLSEITSSIHHNQGMFDLDVDPKLGWALRNRQDFPVDVNSADYEAILRIPGVGVMTAQRIVAQRRVRRLRLQDLQKMRINLGKIKPFVCTLDHKPMGPEISSAVLKTQLVSPASKQMALF